ncbi:23847_t:CDS:2, partial [Racocetra persica]
TCNSVNVNQDKVSEPIQIFESGALLDDMLSIISSSQFSDDHPMQRCANVDSSNKQTHFVNYEDTEISGTQIISEQNDIADDQIRDRENQELINISDFNSNKKHRLQALQDVSNNPTYQHNIYRQVTNKNLEDYRSKMENQMHTRYKIHEHVYRVSDLVKIQIAKIDREPGDHYALSSKIFSVFPNNRYRL